MALICDLKSGHTLASCSSPHGLVKSPRTRLVPMNDAPRVSATRQQESQHRTAFQTSPDIPPGGLMLLRFHQGSEWEDRHDRGMDASSSAVPSHQTRPTLQPLSAGEA